MEQNKLKSIAEHATFQSYFNCFLRETGLGEKVERKELPAVESIGKADEWLLCRLEKQKITLYVGLTYWSKTQRHLFSKQDVYYQMGDGGLLPLDYVTLVQLTTKELALGAHTSAQSAVDELMLRIIQSEQMMETILDYRSEDQAALYNRDFTFQEAEQSLLFGHLLHPTPKSRQGFSDTETLHYSPELKGAFQLHYFRIPKEWAYEHSALHSSSTDLIKQMMWMDPEMDECIKHQYAQQDSYTVIPLHPWQAVFVKEKPEIKELILQGIVEDLGQMGREFYPTSSLRTVYHPEVPYMFKFSLNIKITNSVRANLWKELERGVEVKKILDSEIGEELQSKYPDFAIMSDPAFLTLKLNGNKETGFEVILRENPFMGEQAKQATPVVALCQDAMEGNRSRLHTIIHDIAIRKGQSTAVISEEWFRRYLDISFSPIMWLYLNKGIAPEAHQQNSVVTLEDGYPKSFYYRDNQGYYFVKSQQERLEKLIPGFNEKSDTVCADDVGDERLRYYFFVNHIFGLINAFGTADLIEEDVLLVILRTYLEELPVDKQHPSSLVDSLLSDATIAAKGNLLTRFYDMDELVGAMETQSVYTHIPNPLYQLKESVYETTSF